MGPPSEDGGYVGYGDSREPLRSASMGPPSEDGGYVLHQVMNPGITGRLQWGRRLRTADIGPLMNLSTSRSSASMGPPSEDGGYHPPSACRW